MHIEKAFPVSFTPTSEQSLLIQQLEYFIFNSQYPVFVLKGYAGTGKTTIISTLIKALPMFALKSVLLAPTGRAAKVLSLYSDKNAFTIHKHIYFTHIDPSQPNTFTNNDNSVGNFFCKLKDNKHKDTVFIVDEASMIGTDSNILDDLIRYVFQGERCRLIFVGDTAQLPPVKESFSPALNTDYLYRNYDLSALDFTLKQVVRQALNSNIVRNASNLRYRIEKDNCCLPLLKLQHTATHLPSEQQPTNDSNTLNDLVSISAADFEEYLQNAYNQYGQDNVICICRSNKSANILNNRIRYTILDRENIIDSGDNLMAVKNNYFWLDNYSKEGFIANGDILKIKRILGYEDKYGYHFADIIANFTDYEDNQDIELTVLLDTLNIDKACLEQTAENSLYYKVFEDYYKECNNKAEARKNTLNDKYFNAVQVKFATCLTCHKAQGGGWKAVFIFQDYFTSDMLSKDYLRWLYTAVTRAKEKLFLVNFHEDFFTR